MHQGIHQMPLLRLICEFRLAQGQARHRRPQSKNLQFAEPRKGERLTLPYIRELRVKHLHNDKEPGRTVNRPAVNSCVSEANLPRYQILVEVNGFEPMTSGLQSRRSPN